MALEVDGDGADRVIDNVLVVERSLVSGLVLSLIRFLPVSTALEVFAAVYDGLEATYGSGAAVAWWLRRGYSSGFCCQEGRARWFALPSFVHVGSLVLLLDSSGLRVQRGRERERGQWLVLGIFAQAAIVRRYFGGFGPFLRWTAG